MVDSEAYLTGAVTCTAVVVKSAMVEVPSLSVTTKLLVAILRPSSALASLNAVPSLLMVPIVTRSS